jgi:hypothetical protein
LKPLLLAPNLSKRVFPALSIIGFYNMNKRNNWFKM